MTNLQKQHLIILYASETGNSEEIAQSFLTDERFLNNPCIEVSISSFLSYHRQDDNFEKLLEESSNLTDNSSKHIALIVSTTGNGDIPTRSQLFYRSLKKLVKKYKNDSSTQQLPLSHIQMYNLGLGDSNYRTYNQAIHTIEQLFLKLGASRSIPTALSDSALSTADSVVDEWKEQILQSFKKYSTNNNNNDIITNSTLSPQTYTESTDIQNNTTAQNTNLTRKIFVEQLGKSSSHAVKPPFLLKSQPITCSTYLMHPSVDISHLNKQQKNAHSYLPDMTCIQPIYNTDQINLDEQYPLYSCTKTLQNTKSVLFGESTILKQFLTTQNIINIISNHECLQPLLHSQPFSTNIDLSHDVLLQQLLKYLSSIEFGYSSIGTTPLFGRLENIYNLSPETTNDNDKNDIKPVYNLTFNASPDVVLALRCIYEYIFQNDQKCINTNNSNIDNNTTINNNVFESLPQDYFSFSQYNIPTTHSSTSSSSSSPPSSSSSSSSSPSESISLATSYQPGDSVSLLCPNSYKDVLLLLKSSNLLSFFDHQVLTASPLDTTASQEEQQQSQEQEQVNGSEGHNNADEEFHTILSSLTPKPTGGSAIDIDYGFFQHLQDNILKTSTTSLSNYNGLLYSITNQKDKILEKEPPEGSSSNNENDDNINNNDHLIPKFVPIAALPSVLHVFSNIINISSPIKKSILRSLADYTRDNDNSHNDQYTKFQTCVVELFYELMSKNGRQKLKNCIETPQITLPNLLRWICFQDNDSDITTNNTSLTNTAVLQPSLTMLLSLASRLSPRSYSLSSSPLDNSFILSTNCTKTQLSFDAFITPPKDNNQFDQQQFLSTLSDSFHIPTHGYHQINQNSDIIIIDKDDNNNDNANSNTTRSGGVTLYGGNNFNISATLHNLHTPPLSDITHADYIGSTPYHHSTLLSSTNYYSKQNEKKHLENVNKKEEEKNQHKYDHIHHTIHHGLCTHWFQNILYDYNELLSHTNGWLSCEEFAQWLSKISPKHGEPRFYGCVIEIENVNDINHNEGAGIIFPSQIHVYLPYFYHPAINFHPFSHILNTTTSDSSSSINNNTDHDSNSTNNKQNEIIPSIKKNISPYANMLMIGPGTGVSPFISFIKHGIILTILRHIISYSSLPLYITDKISHRQSIIQDKKPHMLSPQILYLLRNSISEILQVPEITSNNDLHTHLIDKHDEYNSLKKWLFDAIQCPNVNLPSLFTNMLTLAAQQQSSSLEPNNSSNEQLTSTNITSLTKMSIITGNQRFENYLCSGKLLQLLSLNLDLDQISSVFSRELSQSTLSPSLPQQQAEISSNNVINQDKLPLAIKYVQDIIHVQGYAIAKHILSGGSIFICGDGTTMARQVQIALTDAILQHCDELFTYYSLTYDVYHDDDKKVYKSCRTHEIIPSSLMTYMQKDITLLKTQPERIAWVRGLLQLMTKSARYITDVW